MERIHFSEKINEKIKEIIAGNASSYLYSKMVQKITLRPQKMLLKNYTK